MLYPCHDCSYSGSDGEPAGCVFLLVLVKPGRCTLISFWALLLSKLNISPECQPGISLPSKIGVFNCTAHVLLFTFPCYVVGVRGHRVVPCQ